jgi:hypothetical protein
VPPELEGVASGANNTFREVGGVLGIAALGAVFASRGGYATGHAYVAGLVPAVWVGVAVVAVGALVAMLLPRRLGAAHTATARAAEPAAEPVDGPMSVSKPVPGSVSVSVPVSGSVSVAVATAHGADAMPVPCEAAR